MSTTQTTLTEHEPVSTNTTNTDANEADTTTSSREHEHAPQDTDNEPDNTKEDDSTTNSAPDNPTINNTIEFDANNPQHIDDNTTVYVATNPDDHISLPDSSIRKSKIFYLADPVEQYVETYNAEPIEVPQYYTRFDDISHTVSQTALSRDGGFGVTGRRLERVIRVLAGKGGFKHDKLTVYIGPGTHFLVEYDNHAVVVETESHKDPSYEPDTYDINGMQIPEENEAMRDGLRAFLDVIQRFEPFDITEYDEMRGKTHQFHTTSDTTPTVSIRGHQLKEFIRPVDTIDEVTGEYTFETQFDETYTGTITADAFPYDPGDHTENHTPDDQFRTRTVFGYSWAYEDPRTSGRVSLSGKINVYAKTHYYTITDKGRVEADVEKETVDEFETRNEDYHPISSHL